MSHPVKQLRQFDRVEPTRLWSEIEAREPGPELPPPLRPIRRALVIAAALAIFAGAGVFAWQAFRPATTNIGSSSPTPPPGMSVYTDSLGWTAFYPSGWSVTTEQQTADGLGAGVMIANRGPGEKIPVDDVVSLTITHPIDATPDRSAGSSLFPLATSDFKVDPGPEEASSLEFMMDGVRFLATLHVGSAASRADVTAMDEVIASIRPPSSSPDRIPANEVVQQTIVIRPGVDGTGPVVFAPPPADGIDEALTAAEALQAFKVVDPQYTAADPATPLLGSYTAPSGPDTYRFQDHLAWGFKTTTICPPSPNPTDSQSPSGECTDWLFLDARTGKMLEATFVPT